MDNLTYNKLKKNLAFRAWYYFRMGWSNYLTFAFSAANTLTVTYYLAIEKVPSLQSIFPSFVYYTLITTTIGIPCLVAIGYLHFKKSRAFQAEADVSIEANPHTRRMLVNTEKLLLMNYKLNELVLKMLKNEKLTDEEIEQIRLSQQELSEHMTKTTI